MAQTMIEEPWSARGLHGTLTKSATTTAPGPAVLIIAGSGPTDRDGNGPGLATDTYKLIAQGLASQGIQSVRYDKRGLGESRALLTREDEARLGDFVDDAAAAARALSQRADVSSVFLAGHSEGALIAVLAAQKIEVAGVMLLAATGRPLITVLREQMQEALPDPLRQEAFRVLDRLATGEPVTDVPAELRTLFRPSVQPFLLSVINIDPAAELSKLTVPALAVHAERDLQIASADIEASRKSRARLRVVILPEANHTLKAAPADRAGNIALYRNPNAPLDPGLMPVLVDFIHSTAAIR